MSDYDAWILQTPEEYNGYTDKLCRECGEVYDSPAGDDSNTCTDCDEDET